MAEEMIPMPTEDEDQVVLETLLRLQRERLGVEALTADVRARQAWRLRMAGVEAEAARIRQAGAADAAALRAEAQTDADAARTERATILGECDEARRALARLTAQVAAAQAELDARTEEIAEVNRTAALIEAHRQAVGAVAVK